MARPRLTPRRAGSKVALAMRFRPSQFPVRVTRLAVFAAIVAVVVAITGYEAAHHGHVPAVDGSHDKTPHGTTSREDGFNCCSICRLAHETSAGPVAPVAVSEPLRMIAPPSKDRSALAVVVLAREHSPRAPPCLASC